jgi:succinate-semialdehyde dehydrogenase/glutarate-semialdehyde dehydrogenase
MRDLETRQYIGGEFVLGDDAPIAILNPANDAQLAEIRGASAAMACRAADGNAGAARAMRQLPLVKRVELVRRLAAALRAESALFAALLTAESGKPAIESRGEVEYAATFFDNAAAAAEVAAGEIPSSRTDTRRIMVLREPIGATVAITPWNFPLAMIARKLAPALAAGCSQVVKPAEETPLTALLFAEIFARCAADCGAPASACSVVIGDPPTIAGPLIAHPATRKLSFTGSTEVGRILASQCAPRLLKTALELGGNAPFLVFKHADLDRAVEQAMLSKFRFMGQTCICANRFLLEASIAEEFLSRLESRVRELSTTIGDPSIESTRVGPLINDSAIDKVEAHVNDAIARGAQLRCGGSRADIAGLSRRFYLPTILTRCNPSMRCMREETFGPLVAAMTFTSEAEAITLANDVPFGLAGYVMTQDADQLLRVAESLEFGVIGANDGAPSTAEAPFGGRKDSGVGKEGGTHGLDAYTDLKYLSVRVRGA